MNPDTLLLMKTDINYMPLSGNCLSGKVASSDYPAHVSVDNPSGNFNYERPIGRVILRALGPGHFDSANMARDGKL